MQMLSVQMDTLAVVIIASSHSEGSIDCCRDPAGVVKTISEDMNASLLHVAANPAMPMPSNIVRCQ